MRAFRPALAQTLARTLALLLGSSCSPPPASPSPASSPASSSASSPAAPLFPEATASSGDQPAPEPTPAAPAASSSQLRPYRGSLVSDDVATLFPARARLERRSPVRLRLGEGEAGIEPAKPPQIVPLELVVVEQREGWVRVVHESDGYRLLVWAGLEALGRAPAKLTRLALKPGVFPDPPGGGAGGSESGVFLLPGVRPEAREHRGSWAAVELSEWGFRARGWVDESTFEPVWTPAPSRSSLPNSSGVYTGTRLLSFPGGPAVGEFPAETPGRRDVLRWVERLGQPSAGFVRIRFHGAHLLAEGVIAESAFVPPSGGSVGRRLPRMMVSFRDPKVVPAFSLPPGTDLFDQPDGELVGRAFQKAWAPDRLPARVERGRRLIEVPSGQLGLVKVWVDEAALSPYVAEEKGAK